MIVCIGFAGFREICLFDMEVCLDLRLRMELTPALIHCWSSYLVREHDL
jgi:hypothetical protein